MSRSTVIIAVVVAILLAAPMFIVVPMSFSTAPSLEFPPPGYWLGYYRRFFSDPNWTGPVLNSFLIGLGTMVLAMLLGAPASFALVRYRFRFRAAFRLVVMMPLIVPHIVMALGYYSYFGSLGLVQSMTGVILAHACLSIPVVVLTLTSALVSFDRRLENAAANLGARPLKTFRLVTFPILRPAFLVAALFAFIHSFDEAVIAIFISGRDSATLPRQMFNSFQMEADPAISAASSLLLAAVLAGLGAQFAARLVRRQRPATTL
ncbi:ABC transporter permease [Bosea sp. NBC_00550]|uniref:ABC transporter permease n=1 Tax=Bosea sp. NBC_00550 TaxID=2969621 RepID=UPI002230C394|nr:ABC transporter permease [Bosea sp. NBC_00550]UZF95633.1 ABC transporter permease [Bosea sp. NBC_00550]